MFIAGADPGPHEIKENLVRNGGWGEEEGGFQLPPLRSALSKELLLLSITFCHCILKSIKKLLKHKSAIPVYSVYWHGVFCPVPINTAYSLSFKFNLKPIPLERISIEQELNPGWCLSLLLLLLMQLLHNMWSILNKLNQSIGIHQKHNLCLIWAEQPSIAADKQKIGNCVYLINFLLWDIINNHQYSASGESQSVAAFEVYET